MAEPAFRTGGHRGGLHVRGICLDISAAVMGSVYDLGNVLLDRTLDDDEEMGGLDTQVKDRFTHVKVRDVDAVAHMENRS